MRRLVRCARAEVASRQVAASKSTLPNVSDFESTQSANSVSTSSRRPPPGAAADDCTGERVFNEAVPRAMRMREVPDPRLALRLYTVAARARRRQSNRQQSLNGAASAPAYRAVVPFPALLPSSSSLARNARSFLTKSSSPYSLI